VHESSTAAEPRARAYGVAALLASLVFLGVLTALFIPALSKARNSARAAACAGSLKQVSLILAVYADKNGGRYPPLSPIPGRIMFPHEMVYPEYMTDFSVVICYGHPEKKRLKASPVDVAVDDHSHFYMSHVVSNEKEVRAFAEAYRMRVAEGKSFDEDFTVPDGQGNNAGNTLFRIRNGIDKVLSIPAATIPVTVERPGRHDPPGLNVLYLDGHVECIGYGKRFPMTEAVIAALTSLDRLAAPL